MTMQPTPTTQILLLDGPISVSGALSRRQRLVSDMAQVLLQYEAFRNEDDAFRTLFNRKKWSTFDIMACVDDARQVGFQEVVYREMGES